MSAVTKIRPEAQASIHVSAEHVVSAIDPLMYGGFVEHMGRCIYGGLYDPENKHQLIDSRGFRVDVVECIKELDPGIIRWPGGNFTATYHWLDGVGPREQRPKRVAPAWLGTESNYFGTDEFIEWCNETHVEPFIALNMGTGTLDEALAWVEYCNLNTDTYYASLRRQNGHIKPYNVKYWALGNETWGPWQVEQNTKEQYAEKAVQWAKALKMVDPSITLVLCGRDGRSDWDRYVIQKCLRYIDMVSIHTYTFGKEHLANALAPRAAERAIEITASLIDLARTEDDFSMFPEALDRRPLTQFRPKICFDEWNVWNPERAPGEKGAEESYDLSDMLAVAIWLNVFVRQSQHIGLATIAQSVNVISPLMVYEDGTVKQTTYWPLYLFSKYMRGHTLATQSRSPFYEGPTEPQWLQSTADLPILDVSAALSDDHHINLAVANVSETEDFATLVNSAEHPVQVFRVGGKRHTLCETNGRKSQGVVIQEETWNGVGPFTFERHSFTLLRWKAASSPEKVLYGPAHSRGLNKVSNNLTSRK